MTRNMPASVRARLLSIAKGQGADFNQVLVLFALERSLESCAGSSVGTGSVQRQVVGSHIALARPERTGSRKARAASNASSPAE